ncbi:MAG TPA: ABC transporter permease, partial [Candidatus Sulfopaludibacter sp.]|nr:ABC transporter permease [Candidatus Sulfopaludibacter sp.]
SHQLRYVLRALLRSPGFTIITVVTIAVGIGANAAIFSVVNGVLLKPLAYPEPDRLVAVREISPVLDLKDLQLAPADYFTFREENRTFERFGLWDSNRVSVTGLGTPEQVPSITVTADTLPALGVPPALGHWFSTKDDAPEAARTVILSYGYWQRKFGGDRSAIGRSIHIDGNLCQIIGVMPAGFRLLDETADLFQPFRLDRGKTTLGNYSFNGIARLKPGVTLQQANADVGRMIPIELRRFPPPPGFSAKLFEQARFRPDLQPLKDNVIGSLGKILWVLMGSIGVVLLIACANVANLLLVRAEGRQQEIAVRTALGANWQRIVAVLLTESIVLGLAGGVAGLGIAYGAVALLVKLAPRYLPRVDSIAIDPVVLLFTLALSLGASLLFGSIPALKYAAPRVSLALRAGGRTLSQSRERHRARNTLVVLQTALAVVLLIGSGLMIRTFQALRKVQPGFRDPAQVQTLRIFIPDTQVKEPVRVIRMEQEIRDKLAAIPGVVSAAYANSVPDDGNNSTDLLYAEDRFYAEGQLPPLRRFKFVAPGFFQTIGTPLVAGRDYTWTDIYQERKYAIVSANMARELWRSPAAALGKRIREGMNDDWREIIGVVGDVHHDGADQKPPTVVYWPVLMTQFWRNDALVQRGVAYAVRTSRAGSQSFLEQARQAVWSIDPDLPLARVETMEQIYRGSMARSAFTLVMIAIAGGMALLLGLVGIYGVISYSVSQRTRELGIRLALGAQQFSLKTMIIRNGLALAGIGAAVGLAISAGLTRIMASWLYGISPLDALTYAAVSLGVLTAAAAASYLPARRVSGLNPVEALRAE